MILRSFLAIAILGGSCAAAAHAESWSFQVKPGERLEVDLQPGGDVEIRGEAGSTVTVESHVDGRDAEDFRVVASQVAGGVRVRADMEHRGRSYSIDAHVAITVPSHFDLDLSSYGGGFKIVGVEGRIDGKTQGGGITLERVKGQVSLETMGGEIEARDVDASGSVETMGGDVRFFNVRGGLSGKTMGGSLSVDGGGPVRLSTMGGAIRMKSAPPGSKLSTMGGEIELDAAQAPLEATTMGGDVAVHVTGGTGEIELSSKGGDLEVWLPAAFAADFDVELVQTRGSDGRYKIASDFELQRDRKERPASYRGDNDRETVWTATGKSGAGGSRVRLSTVNGNIRIHRAP